MSAIFGYGRLDAVEVDKQFAPKMLKRMNHWNADSHAIWEAESMATGFLLLKNTPQSHWEKQPFFDTESKMSITADASLFNREELMEQLGINQDEKIPDSQLILKSYKKWGEDCPAYLNGGFAFAIWNSKDESFFCARDHHGIKPFYYFSSEGHFAYASEIKGLLELPFIEKKIDAQWAVDFLCRIWLDKKPTLYKNIKRLEPAHSMHVDRNGIRFNTYWDLSEIKEIKLNSDEEYIEAFRDKLVTAVERRARSAYNIASELSGGIDSSAVSSIAKTLLNEKGLCTYSSVLPEAISFNGLYDEREWINRICEHIEIKDKEFITGEGHELMKAFDWNHRVQDEPPKDMNCMFRDIMYENMKLKNVRTLLSGFGGDEMVSHHASSYLKALMQNRQWKHLNKEIKWVKKIKKKSYFSIVSTLMLSAFFNHDARRINRRLSLFYNKASPLQEKLKSRPLKNSLYKKFNVQKRFEKYQDLYMGTGNFVLDQIRRMQQPHVMYRLEASDIAARSCKVEYAYPLLDIPLIEFYLSLPIHLKARDGKGRFIFRKAIEPYLPNEIVWRSTKKGSSNPHLIIRSQLDYKKIKQELFSIPETHPIRELADFEDIEKVIQAKSSTEVSDWKHTTTDFMNLLLARKIESN